MFTYATPWMKVKQDIHCLPTLRMIIWVYRRILRILYTMHDPDFIDPGLGRFLQAAGYDEVSIRGRMRQVQSTHTAQCR